MDINSWCSFISFFVSVLMTIDETRLGFLRTKIKKFWTLQIKDQDQKITFTKWSKIVNSADQEIKDHFRSQSLMRSKIKRSLSEKIMDQRRIKDQSSQIKQIKSSSNSFYQLPGKGSILCLICWLLKTTSNVTVKQTVLMKHKTWKVVKSNTKHICVDCVLWAENIFCLNSCSFFFDHHDQNCEHFFDRDDQN